MESNNAKLREALFEIVLLCRKVGLSIHGDVACGIIASKARAALAAPPRNCDRYQSNNEAFAAYSELIGMTVGYCDWLYSTAEGGDDGRK